MWARTALYTVLGFVLFAAVLFWPAGTWDYWQGWAFLVVMAAISLPYTGYLILKAPDRLQRRLKSGPAAETRRTQKLAAAGLQVGFLVAMVVSGLDHRFGWSHLPTWLSIVGIALLAIGLTVAVWVVVQNAWAAATITVESGQELVSTGFYGVVRHPMYSGAILMLVGLPLGLGSWWAAIPAAVGVVALIVRTIDEEVMLRDELAGYPEYTEQVRYRVLPGVW